MTEEQEDFRHLDEDRLFKHLPRRRARSAWWLHCFHNGRLIVLGPYYDQMEADRDNYSKIEGKGETIELNTIDKSAATQILKKKLLDRTRDLDTAMRKARHEAGLAHEKKTGEIK